MYMCIYTHIFTHTNTHTYRTDFTHDYANFSALKGGSSFDTSSYDCKMLYGEKPKLQSWNLQQLPPPMPATPTAVELEALVRETKNEQKPGIGAGGNGDCGGDCGGN